MSAIAELNLKGRRFLENACAKITIYFRRESDGYNVIVDKMEGFDVGNVAGGDELIDFGTEVDRVVVLRHGI